MRTRHMLLAAAAMMTLTATPLLAQNAGQGNGDTNIQNFVNQSPHQAPTTNGTPEILGNRDGQPVVRYEGDRGPGLQDGRTPRIVGNRDGQPVIQYGSGAPNPPPRGHGTGSNIHGGAAGTAAGMPASGSATTMRDPSVSASIAPMVTRARAALQRGNYAAASTALEQAETALLNARADGTTGHAEALKSVSDARAAAARRDRSGAMQALNGLNG